MDAVRGRTYRVYFGGSYREQWSEDYVLSIAYENRRWVEARRDGGRWIPVDGDEELRELLRSPLCPELTQRYFQTAATVYAAIHDCLARGLRPERLRECFWSGGDDPLAAPELMRLLMDDLGFPLEEAYRVTADCCADLSCTGILPQHLLALQPRTAHVVSILRRTAETVPALIHDSRRAEYRSPFGAVTAGQTLRLAFQRRGGRIERAELVLWGDNFEYSQSMECEGNEYYVNLNLPDKPQALWYAFYVEAVSSAHWLCPDGSGFYGKLFPRREEGFRLTVYRPDFETPAWFRRSVMYQIFPDRFAFSDDGTAERGIAYHESLGQVPELHRSPDEPVRYLPRSFEQAYSPDDFYGGTFKGIEQKLSYLKALGVSCLYLNPIVEARSNHRYDTSDYTRPDPILGTTEDFEHLCSAAREQGIRIILDGVFSHTGSDSRYFDLYGSYGGNGACSGPDSPYYSWYDFKHFPDEYRCWWGFRDLPEVNETNPAWQREIITGADSVVRLWLKRGASGWRLDVADELPDPVLAMIRRTAKETAPDAPVIGEVWEDAVVKESYGQRRSYALGHSLDAVMNYPLRTAVLDFAHGYTDAYDLRNFLTGQQMNYPRPLYYSLMNLLGSHDVARLRNCLATDVDLRELSRDEQLAMPFPEEAMEQALTLERLCAVLQFALPGVPSIYYGDEQGMAGVGDPFNRLPFREETAALHDFYAALCAQRNAAPALSTGYVGFVAVNRDLLLVLRYITDGRDVFGESAENGVYLAVIHRGGELCPYTADCSAAGLGLYVGEAKPLSGEIIRLA
ncbi:MAG: glycoside hydrolase family 13 protein [Oscillospiraceae bacterium]|nr:glycoside hydrolase family 13 protein [Oscillospiraceae bacterium]